MTIATWRVVGGTANGNWGDANHWTFATAPGAGDFAQLPALAANYVVTLDVDTPSLLSLQVLDPTATLAIGAGRTINVGGTDPGAITLGSGGHITMAAGSTIIDAGGFATATGSVTGAGTIKTAGHYFGVGTLTSQGGTLDIFGTVDFGVALAMDPNAPSTLKIENDATSALAISFVSNNQNLWVGGNLTIAVPEFMKGGQIELAGGTLIAKGGIAIDDSTTIFGHGTIIGNLSAQFGTFKASGGTLELVGLLDARFVHNKAPLQIDDNSTLKISGSEAHVLMYAVNLDSASKKLDISAGANLRIDEGIQSVKGTLNVDGTFQAAGIQLLGGTLSGSGSLAKGMNIDGFGTIDLGLSMAGQVRATGVLSINADSDMSVIVIPFTGATLNVNANVTTAVLDVGVHGTGQVHIGTDASLHITGAHQVLPFGNINLHGGDFVVDNGFEFNFFTAIPNGQGIHGYGKVITGVTDATSFTGGGGNVALGGVLEFVDGVNSGVNSEYTIATTATLKFDAVVGTNTIHPSVALSGIDTVLDLSGTKLADFHGIVAGLDAGQFIEVAGAARVSLDATQKQLTVFDDKDVSLGSITFATAQNKTFSVDGSHQIFVNNVALGAGGGSNLAVEDPESALSILYIGYLNRAGDADGMSFWQSELQSGTTWQQITQSFSMSSEALALYPFLQAPNTANAATFIDQIYQNLFDRHADAGGMTFWSNALANGVSAGELVRAVALGAQGADADALVNKVSVSNAYVNEVTQANLPQTPELAALAYNSIAPVIDDDTAAVAIAGISTFIHDQLFPS